MPYFPSRLARKIISGSLLILLVTQTISSGLPFSNAQAQAAGSSRGDFSKRDWIKIKKSKRNTLTPEQSEILIERVKSIREKSPSRRAELLIGNLKRDQQTFKNRFQGKDLTESQKQEARTLLRSHRTKLEAINAQIKLDLEHDLNQDLTQDDRSKLDLVEPNYLYESQIFAPNDPHFSGQWGLQSIGVSGIPLTPGASDDPVIVAVIDAGVDFGHPDLSGNQWTDPDCVDALGDPIAGGCLMGGYDFVDDDPNPFPSDNITHGTSVSSLVGASTDNATGMASIGQNNVQIMALRACCTASGFFPSGAIEEAIRFAVNNGAQVINASFGGPTYSGALEQAFAYARDHDVLVVTSAGNYASNNDSTPIYPANYALDNIISVGATTPWDQLTYFSNYGPNSVDLAAPGQDIWLAITNDGYMRNNGTSFSAPLVSATAAQIRRDPALTYAQTRDQLLGNVLTLSSLSGQIQGNRILRFAVQPPDPEPDPGPTPDPEPDPTPDPIPDPDPTPDPTPDPEDPSPPACGDGSLDQGEMCDDGNLSNGDGCSAICTIEGAGSEGGGDSIIPLAGLLTGDLVFHHEDHLTGGSVDTDEAAAVVQLLDYYPYGDIRIDDHAIDYQNDYKFTGKEQDDETDLLYYESRYYAPFFARFLSPDPWDGDLHDPQSLNKYSYVLNNPLKYTDPSGETFEDFLTGLFGIETAYAPASVDILNAPQYDNSLHAGIGVAASFLGLNGIRHLAKEGIKGILRGGAKEFSENLGNDLTNKALKRSGRGKNHISPYPNAKGDHTVIQRNAEGNIKKYATYKQNPKNPTGFDQVKRVDLDSGTNHFHYNKATKQDVRIPHTHTRQTPGGVRPATKSEIPKSYSKSGFKSSTD